MAKNIEKSREIRQWIKLGIEGASLLAAVDYISTDGKHIKKIRDWSKDKIDRIKNKI